MQRSSDRPQSYRALRVTMPRVCGLHHLHERLPLPAKLNDCECMACQYNGVQSLLGKNSASAACGSTQTRVCAQVTSECPNAAAVKHGGGSVHRPTNCRLARVWLHRL